MPIPAIGHFLLDGGFFDLPYVWPTLKAIPWLFLLYVLKIYFGGARNTSERDMHGKVVLITGGTSGIGAAVARELATRGAQIVLLTQHSLTDPFLVDYIFDLRAQTSNELITAEQVDLSSLHSIRLFATKWIDNAPPRRLDTLILCANTLTPKGSPIAISADGVESNFALNYLANFHLLSILSPALRAQPADRDVRIIFSTCSSYMAGKLPEQVPMPKPARKGKNKTILETATATNPGAAYASSKLALMTFASAFQKHLSTYARPDKNPVNAKVLMVDAGYSRTPGMRRYMTFGSLWGLAIYLITWPLWWLLLKSPEQGAQTYLFAAMEASFAREAGGQLLKECMAYKIVKDEVQDEVAQKKLWELSEKAIEALEKEGAVRRALLKKEQEEAERVTEIVDEKPTTANTKDKENEKRPASRRARKQA